MPDGSDVRLPTSNYSQALEEIELFLDKIH